MTKTSSMAADLPNHNTETSNENQGTAKPLWRRLLPLMVLIAGLIAAWATGLLDFLSFDTLRENREFLQGFVTSNPVSSVLVFMTIYVIAVALSLPIGSLLTIAGGFMFGAFLGTSYIVLAATIGAVVVYLAARYAFYDLMQAKAGNAIRKMEQGFAENAFSYLMVLIDPDLSVLAGQSGACPIGG